jgi:hypothetical protein
MTVQIALRLDDALAADARAAAEDAGTNLSEWMRRAIKSEADQAKYRRALAEELAEPLYTDEQEDAIMATRARRHLAWQDGEAA